MSLNTKELKLKLKEKTDVAPEKYYAVSVLKEKGYSRHKCKVCGKYFWSMRERDVCGDPDCIGGYQFIHNPVGKKMDYIQTWTEFSNLFKKKGYTPIKRYPVAARWRDDTDFVQASIYDFQPHVVSGEAEPPANPLVVPQYCLRFNDIDNVGITGRHNTGFIMTGQHAFVKPSEFDQPRYFSDIHDWLTVGMRVPAEEITYKEDQWGGGGNLGVCMEFFVRGLEVGNQVYMMYKTTDAGYSDLDLRILDMGMGHNRCTWLTNGTPTVYEVSYPTVCRSLFEKTGVKLTDTFEKFMPLAGVMDLEGGNIAEKWDMIAKKMKMSTADLKKQVLPLSNLFAVMDHSQSLLFALSDGVLPSNVGGGYNLRVIARRAMTFIEEHGWSFALPDVCAMHAQYLKPMFPELSEHVDEVGEILEFEHAKYEQSRIKAKKKVESIVKTSAKLAFDQLKTLYESDGITPELIKETASTTGKTIDVPPDFYSQLSAGHEAKQKETVVVHFDVKGTKATEKLYFEKPLEFDATVVKSLDHEGRHYVVLDRTAFYATSGGQDCDTGTLNGTRVLQTLKEGDIILHEVEKPVSGRVHGIVDAERRLQLTKNHTAAHIINGAARKLLGEHIWQAGSEKTVEKARLDITHYDQLTDEQVKKMEEIANDAIKRSLKINKGFFPRGEAEKRYGFRLYQGGAVPGKSIRVVEIVGFDVEACGGTHADNTADVECIKILRTKKVRDGVVRVEFIAGKKMCERAVKDLADCVQKDKDTLLRKITLIINEKMKLGGQIQDENLRKMTIPQLEEAYKRMAKDLESFKKQKAGKADVSEPVLMLKQGDMKILQEIGAKALEKFGYAVVFAPGMVLALKKPDNKKGVEAAVAKAAEIMGGKAGGRNGEWKGGGPKKEKTKEAYEATKKALS